MVIFYQFYYFFHIFTGCSQLKEVYLYSNRLTKLPTGIFAGCSQLNSIELENNQLTELPADLFADCSHLRYIYLHNNQLTELPVDLFAGCSQLKGVYLCSNQLTELPVDLFAGCSQILEIRFDKSIVYGILWSLCDLNKPIIDHTGRKIMDEFPIECELVKRFRRVADDPLSYAWSARRHVLIGMEI
jgi:Leucine-rich repeat (LRR) protein